MDVFSKVHDKMRVGTRIRRECGIMEERLRDWAPSLRDHRPRSCEWSGGRKSRGREGRREWIRYRFVRRGRLGWGRTSWIELVYYVVMAYELQSIWIRQHCRVILQLIAVVVYVQSWHVHRQSSSSGRMSVRVGGDIEEGTEGDRMSIVLPSDAHVHHDASHRCIQYLARAAQITRQHALVFSLFLLNASPLPIFPISSLVMDVASLRAEIKAWERDFRSKHTRDPTIQEIKNQPAIGIASSLFSCNLRTLRHAPSQRPSTNSTSLYPRHLHPPLSQARLLRRPQRLRDRSHVRLHNQPRLPCFRRPARSRSIHPSRRLTPFPPSRRNPN